MMFVTCVYLPASPPPASLYNSESEWYAVPVDAVAMAHSTKALLALANAPNKDPFLDGGATGTRLALLVPFRNCGLYAAHGLYTYRCMFVGSSHYSALQVLLAQGRTIQGWVSSKSAAAGERKLNKADALQRIRHLESRLEVFQYELQTGSNPMKSYDASLAEIADTKAEITWLQRKYVNSFYFF